MSLAAPITAERPAAPSATRRVPPPTPAERFASGRALRAAVPLASHAEAARPTIGRDPVRLLESQAVSRLPELEAIRYGRMLVSPFTFYRGAALVMAADLADAPRSGLTVQMCGDAHLSNFGLYGSPERQLMFDTNDFDETLPGPFEHDVKRLVASLEVAARGNGLGRKRRREVTLAAAARYRTAMTAFAADTDLGVWYSRLEADSLLAELAPRLNKTQSERLTKTLKKARTRDVVQAFHKLTEVTDGRVRLRAEPPLMVPIRDLLSATDTRDVNDTFRGILHRYRDTLETDRQQLLDRYTFVDVARKVVGVGSVGTRCWVVLLRGRDDDDPLLLQVKEATASVYEEFEGESEYTHHGERVVAGQRLMQQASDIFLGWLRTPGIDGIERDFYVRQLRDWKGSLEIEQIRPEGLVLYGEACAWCLARGHARSGDRIAIAGYLGATTAFDNALADFAETYADTNEADHRLLADAAADGRIVAQAGL